jgi:hypothetical protein
MAGDGDNSGSGGAGPGGVGDGGYGGSGNTNEGGPSGLGTTGYSDKYGSVTQGTGLGINDGSMMGDVRGFYANMSWTDMMSYYSNAYAIGNIPGLALAGLGHVAAYAERKGWGPDNGMTQAERASALSDGANEAGPLGGGTNWLDYGGGNPYYMTKQREAQYYKSKLWADYINKFKPGSLASDYGDKINPYKVAPAEAHRINAEQTASQSLLEDDDDGGK